MCSGSWPEESGFCFVGRVLNFYQNQRVSWNTWCNLSTEFTALLHFVVQKLHNSTALSFNLPFVWLLVVAVGNGLQVLYISTPCKQSEPCCVLTTVT
jgi:hypothetical protein